MRDQVIFLVLRCQRQTFILNFVFSIVNSCSASLTENTSTSVLEWVANLKVITVNLWMSFCFFHLHFIFVQEFHQRNNCNKGKVRVSCHTRKKRWGKVAVMDRYIFVLPRKWFEKEDKSCAHFYISQGHKKDGFTLIGNHSVTNQQPKPNHLWFIIDSFELGYGLTLRIWLSQEYDLTGTCTQFLYSAE